MVLIVVVANHQRGAVQEVLRRRTFGTAPPGYRRLRLSL